MADLHTLRVAADLPCLRCKYDLRGLHADGRCPECGLELIASIAARIDPELMDLPPLPRPRIAAWTVLAVMLALTTAVIAQTLSCAAIAITSLPTGWMQTELSRILPITLVPRLIEAPPVALSIAFVAAILLLVATGTRGAARIGLLVGIAGWLAASFVPASSRALTLTGIPAAITLLAFSPILVDLGLRSRTYRARHTARQTVRPLELAIALGVASYAAAEGLEPWVGYDFTTPLRLVAVLCVVMTLVGFCYLLVNAAWVCSALARWQPLLERVIDREGGASAPAPK